jgi:hypothetical protein
LPSDRPDLANCHPKHPVRCIPSSPHSRAPPHRQCRGVNPGQRGHQWSRRRSHRRSRGHQRQQQGCGLSRQTAVLFGDRVRTASQPPPLRSGRGARSPRPTQLREPRGPVSVSVRSHRELAAARRRQWRQRVASLVQARRCRIVRRVPEVLRHGTVRSALPRESFCEPNQRDIRSAWPDQAEPDRCGQQGSGLRHAEQGR